METRRRPPNAGKGRPKGALNKVTRDVRAAIAEFAQNNVHKLQPWLDRVAKKDPARAADLFIRVLEYHVPKLARSELELEPPTSAREDVRELTINEIRARLAAIDEQRRLYAAGKYVGT